MVAQEDLKRIDAGITNSQDYFTQLLKDVKGNANVSQSQIDSIMKKAQADINAAGGVKKLSVYTINKIMLAACGGEVDGEGTGQDLLSTTKELPFTSNPNDHLKQHKDGEIYKERWYGEDGNPIKDKHYTDHGNSKKHPNVPHEHDWKKDDDGIPKIGEQKVPKGDTEDDGNSELAKSIGEYVGAIGKIVLGGVVVFVLYADDLLPNGIGATDNLYIPNIMQWIDEGIRVFS